MLELIALNYMNCSSSSTDQVSPVTPMFNIQEFMLPSGSSRITKRKRYSPYEKKQAMLAWTHKFVSMKHTVPSGHEKYTLRLDKIAWVDMPQNDGASGLSHYIPLHRSIVA